MRLIRTLAGLLMLTLAAIAPAQLSNVPSYFGVVGGTITVVGGGTPYSSGDLMANSGTAASVVPLSITACRLASGSGTILRARLSTAHTGLAGTEAFRVHLFKSSPTVVNGDNAAYSVNGVAAIEIGRFDITLDQVSSDGSKGIATPTVGNAIIYDCASGSQTISALLEARGAYTASASEVFSLALEQWPD